MRDHSALRRQMFAMVEEWQQSGQTQKAFCAQHQISYHRFYYWRKAYRKHSGISTTSFVSLQVERPVSPPGAEVHFPGGVRIIFNHQVSSSFLKSLIS